MPEINPTESPRKEKRCTGCGEMKSVLEFSRNRSKTDGLGSRCKACVSKDNKLHYQPHPRVCRANDTSRTEKYCPKCDTTQSILNFRRNKNSGDGLSYRCKTCDGREERRRYQPKQRPLVYAITDASRTEKYCPGCRVVKSSVEFHRNKDRADGIDSRCKRCAFRASKAYREAHPDAYRASNKRRYWSDPEAAKASVRAWIAANPERYRERRRCYWRENSARLKAKHKEYVMANWVRVKVAQARWRAANKDHIRFRMRQYLKANPDKFRIAWHKRRERARINGGTFTVAEWRSLCDLYGNRCLCCGKRKKLTIDHVVPLFLGGSNSIGNIQPLCLKCNLRKGRRTIDYRTPVVGRSSMPSAP